jgi:hypothetical protein
LELQGERWDRQRLARRHLRWLRLSRRLRRAWLGTKPVRALSINGSFDFRYEYVSDDLRPDVVASIITSLGELGLGVKGGRAQVETIVIDDAEKPSPN